MVGVGWGWVCGFYPELLCLGEEKKEFEMVEFYNV